MINGLLNILAVIGLVTAIILGVAFLLCSVVAVIALISKIISISKKDDRNKNGG